ncbi:MAG TPA: S8 family peptidase [Gemmatimonadaceae bacterium]|nr:S8 family peptidase [Gemmatimonadaceae bacterium]
MAIQIPRAFVEFILLGPMHDRRQLQDSPMLGDVWLAFANAPDKAIELLIAPHKTHSAGEVAGAIDEKLDRGPDDPANISSVYGVVAARLYFHEVVRIVMPMTKWWHRKSVQSHFAVLSKDDLTAATHLDRITTAILEVAKRWKSGFDEQFAEDLLPTVDRLVALAGLILWAGSKDAPKAAAGASMTSSDEMLLALQEAKPRDVQKVINPFITDILKSDELVWQISLNRTAVAAVDKSIPSVKADAARTLFGVDCSDIAWAVIDSGIQGNHEAFKDSSGDSRVIKSFDFSNIRKIISLDTLKIFDETRNDARRADKLKELLKDDLADKPTEDEASKTLAQLAQNAKHRRAIQWELVRPFVEISPKVRPRASDHGTHVAGILGARKPPAETPPNPAHEDVFDGMCPDIQLYDFRVLGSDTRDTEFAIIATLQFIRYLNARTDYMTIHGANLSLSIPHDVRNYACGRTPICVECERLVDTGVVVVAAAGNLGYQSFTTREGSYEGTAAFSVTDPGNAEGVITVGATHRYQPHTYGVSFFSSRGPTGDGRAKPDLVAPGERIRGPFREGWGELDGTSMAAPHVSGAAAMLMARYTELIGKPRRIKQLLCDNATDLGREKSFQGYGMLDVLRTFQGI